MAMEIRKSGTAFNIPKRKAIQIKPYSDFLHTLPCVVTFREGVEVAHVSAASPQHGHWGRGKSQKASSRFSLPLCPDEHRKQHAFRGGEMAYWKSVGIDPHGLCLALSGYWFESGDDAYEGCLAIIKSRDW